MYGAVSIPSPNIPKIVKKTPQNGVNLFKVINIFLKLVLTLGILSQFQKAQAKNDRDLERPNKQVAADQDTIELVFGKPVVHAFREGNNLKITNYFTNRDRVYYEDGGITECGASQQFMSGKDCYWKTSTGREYRGKFKVGEPVWGEIKEGTATAKGEIVNRTLTGKGTMNFNFGNMKLTNIGQFLNNKFIKGIKIIYLNPEDSKKDESQEKTINITKYVKRFKDYIDERLTTDIDFSQISVGTNGYVQLGTFNKDNNLDGPNCLFISSTGQKKFGNYTNGILVLD